MRETVGRVLSKVNGTDPLSVHRKDCAALSQIAAESALIDKQIAEAQQAVAELDSGQTIGPFDAAHRHAHLQTLEQRRRDLFKMQKDLEATRPGLAEDAFQDSSESRRLRKDIQDCTRDLALLCAEELRLRATFREQHQARLRDVCSMAPACIDPGRLAAWLKDLETKNA